MKRLTTSVMWTLTLSWSLFTRTIGAKYRKSFLGYFWMFAPAILITGGVTMASRAGVISPGETPLPYPLFVFIGTLMWQVFAEAVEVAHQAFEGARSYLTRVYFPREAIILAQLYESLITTAVRVLFVLVLVLLYADPSWYAVGLILLCFGGAILLGMGIGCLLMPLTLLFSDLQNTIKLVLSYGLFLTPALYVPGKEGAFSAIVRWNPLSPLMNSAREAVAGIPLTHPDALLLVLGLAAAITVVGVGLIRLAAPIVIERMLLGGR